MGCLEKRMAFLVREPVGHRTSAAFLCGIAAAVLILPRATANSFVDMLIRNAGEPAFTGAFVFTPEFQTKSQVVDANQTAVYEFRIDYYGVAQDTVHLRGTRSGTGWVVRYFDSVNGEEITDMVTSADGHAWERITSGTSMAFRLEVTPTIAAPSDQPKTVNITVWPDSAPQRTDSARALTTRLPRIQPDLMVRRDYDLRFTGDNVYNTSGTRQTKSQEIDPNMPAVYFLSLANDGTFNDRFVLTSTIPEEGWTVRFFDAPVGGRDVSEEVLGNGWTSPAMLLNETLELRLEITGSAAVQGVSLCHLLIKATSTTNPEKQDTVKTITAVIPDSTVPHGGVYTSNDDFEKGTLAGVTYETVPDQLERSGDPLTFPYIWVPNSNESTVSKLDTRTGRELARYRTGPEKLNDLPLNHNPSRTTIDQQGNCWVANRQTGSAVKIGLLENGQYRDRNGDGIIQTSRDTNNDGDITGDELLPWGMDECVLFEIVLIPNKEGTFTPGTYEGGYADDNWNPGPRGVAVDANGNVWLGTYGTQKFYHVDGITGRILKTVDFSSVPHHSYGAVIDANGILWSSSLDDNNVLRLDPSDGSFKVVDVGHTVYGLGLDRSNHLFIAGWRSGKLTRLNIITGEKDWTINASPTSRGVAVTEDGDVWTADSGPGTVSRFSNDGVFKESIPVGNTPTGVSIDAAGKVWVVNYGDEYVKRIDPVANRVDLEHRIIGGRHYGYSDMTGIISRTTTTKIGLWTITHDSRYPGATWGTIAWTDFTPPGTLLEVRARSSPDRTSWSLWEIATNAVPLYATPPGKFLQIEVAFKTLVGEDSPVLYDLTVTPIDDTASPPRLVLKKLPANQVELAWEPETDRSVMEQTDNLASPWTSIGLVTSPYRINIDHSTPARFFRLRQHATPAP